MGSVRVETRNEGRGLHEWDYLPLSEPFVVDRLIRKRSRLDAAYYPKQEAVSLTQSAGVFPFSEPVLATYVDLDRLIETCGLSAQQRQIVRMLMDGHTIRDISDDLHVARQTAEIQFHRAVIKITRRNDERWKEIYGKWAR